MRIAVMIMAVVAVTLATSGRQCTSVGSPVADGALKPILSSTTAEWKKGTQLDLVFMVLNDSAKTVSVDGRMSWPGNILLWVRLPDGKTMLARRGLVKMKLLTADGIIRLQPSRLHGRKLAIQPEADERFAEPLKKLCPGTYTFWVEFHGAGAASLGCREVSLKSNELPITVP
ncbi:MAG: hypothetical protein PHV74_16160 [Dehalococcoidia bacterium]|nr:hypothetical protein [Dehalococcoidia bacterium]